MKITITEGAKKYYYSKNKIAELFDLAANYFKISSDYEFSIHFCAPGRIKSLNERFRTKSSATDVLSFPVNAPDEIIKSSVKRKNGPPITLGDIVICPDYIIKNNVKKYETGLAFETAYLLVHGFMHLIGYEHDDDAYDDSKMRADADKFFKNKLKSFNFSAIIKLKRE